MADPIVRIHLDEAEAKAYATVSAEGGWPTLEDVLKALESENVPFWVDETAIAKALEKQRFDESFEVAVARDGQVLISLGPGEKEAFMVLEQAYGGRETVFEDVEQALSEKSIMFGIDETAIRQALADRNYGNKVRIASAIDPINGTDAVIEYLFRTEWVLTPTETDDKIIDYRELQSVTSVRKDAILARKTPATPGEGGMSVTGKPIRAVPGKDARLLPGKNTRLSENGRELISDIDGQPVLSDRVAVEPVVTIDGDIDYSTGNIDFVGSVRVAGSVVSGFSLKASANIQIDGVVEDAVVEAGGDVLIRGGIHGRRSRSVKAGGSVSARFIEQASVEAGARIVAEEVLYSDLTAGDQVIVTSGKGQISGGRVVALNLIHASIVGADSDIRTELVVGFNPQQKARLEGLKEKRTSHEATLSEIEKGISTLKGYQEQGSHLWQRHEQTYEKLVDTRRKLTDRLHVLAYEIGAIEEKLMQAENARIKVAETIYPNVLVRIRNAQFQNESELARTTFYEDEGEIKATVYVL